ncbi:pyridoxal phosphate-dependent aminotransferase [Quadrisphaera sp. GCM10027208]|uniref:pyridoxal phosphate-dependent aminotransferase n=1 Tax=Quadrisphaera sp. GCM10027208 TaxID=3273423 RepID=UPI00361767E6
MPAGLVTRMQGFGTTVFAEMTALARATGAVNLGQGFPDTDGPDELLEAAVAALRGHEHNQYPPPRGVPQLREAIAAHQRDWYGLDVDPDAEVLVTTGATEAIAVAVLALCEPGDEVVTLEPYYDSYAASVALAGAVRRPVPFGPGFSLDAAALEAAVTGRTRLVLLNTPHNPTGRVLDRTELEAVADVARRHDLVVVTDEVYEHLILDDDARHVPLASLPGMAERTLTVSSAGKTFSVTGWKIGWVHGPAALVDALAAVKQFVTFVSGGPLQPAVAGALGWPREFFAEQAADLARRRDVLCEGLVDAGFDVVVPQATYFVLADAAPLGYPDGLELCRRLPELAGVVGVPVQAFADDVEPVRSLVRFAFCKREDVLAEAVRRLRRLRRA